MKVRRLSILILNIFLLVSLTGLIYGSTYNICYSQAAPISAETPKVILQEGTAGTSTIYTNNTSAKVIAAAPAPTPIYYPNTYNVVNGTYLSGSVPDSVQIVDADYFVVESPSSSIGYNPSGYNLLGSTKYVSGSLTDLQSDNSVYMTFRSYVSGTSTTSKTDAFIAYRSNTGTNTLSSPKFRLWDGDDAVWGIENEMATAGSPVRWVRVAVCPKSERALEKIVVTLSDDGYLDAYVFDGTSWTVTNNIGFPGTTANARRCFDVAYEGASGRALLVYSRGTTTNEIGYKIWTFGTGWSSEYLFDLAYTTGIVNWIALASAPGTRSGTADDNEIAMIYLDANSDVHGYVWTGSSWDGMGATAVWDATAAIATEECIAVAYEQISGKAMFIWADATATDFYYRTWDGTTLTGPTLLDITDAGVGNWLSLKSQPASNGLLFGVSDGLADLNTAYWNGSAWTVHIEHDAAIYTHSQRCFDVEWEPDGSDALLVWDTTAGQIAWKEFTPPNTWSAQSNPTMGTGSHSWVKLTRNTRTASGDIMILGAVLEVNNRLGAISWNGTTFTVIGATTFTTDTNGFGYECFDLKFDNFGDPTEFTCEVEFTGTSNTESWSQLTWTIDSAFTTDGVTATFQLYDYNAGQYPTSGDGYITDTMGTSDVTKTQTIITNPARFRDSSGNWKIKAKGVKATATPFDFKVDWIEIRQYYSQYITSTEFIFSNITTNTPTQLNFTVVSEYTVSGVNVTIQVWNYYSSAYATNGEGYLTYTSEGANETKALSININPEFYTSNGYAKIKVTGLTTTEFQQKINQIKLTYQYSASSTYDHVLKIVNQAAENWTINLQIYNSSNIERLSSLNISLHNGASSNQIAISEGTIVKSEGEPYNLTENTTIYISINNLQATTTSTSYLYVYLKIKVPNTTTYTLFIITFEIT